MPVETLYAEMDFSLSPSTKVHRMQRKANGDSGFSSRSRNSDSDDELLSYLSREEQECILFFDTTLDSLNDDFEDGSSVSSLTSDRASTPTRVNSSSEEIIDLVVTRPAPGTAIPRYENVFTVDQEGGRWQAAEEEVHERFAVGDLRRDRLPLSMPVPQSPKQPSFEMSVDEPDVEVVRGFCSQAKPPGSVPTPMVIAQKIAEGRTENGVTHPVSPSESKPFPPPPQEKPRASLTSPLEARVFSFRNPKVQRLPSNISISASSKDYNNTITMAAVKVQERKAQVLANLGGAGLLAVESEEKQLRGPLSNPRRNFSLVLPAKALSPPPPLVKQSSDETDNRLSNGLRSPVGMAGAALSPKFHPVAQTAPHPPPPAAAAKPAPRTPQPSTASAAVQRSCSFQKPSAFRPQGITVQFSGRGSTDESRKEALRKLGLLRINEGQ